MASEHVEVLGADAEEVHRRVEAALGMLLHWRDESHWDPERGWIGPWPHWWGLLEGGRLGIAIYETDPTADIAGIETWWTVELRELAPVGNDIRTGIAALIRDALIDGVDWIVRCWSAGEAEAAQDS